MTRFEFERQEQQTRKMEAAARNLSTSRPYENSGVMQTISATSVVKNVHVMTCGHHDHDAPG